jgi:hypothetical protein
MTVAEASDASTPDNVLDFALAHFAPSTEEELYEAVSSATAPALVKFLDAYGEFAATGTTRAPLLKDGELRPYFPAGDMPEWLQGRFTVDNHTLTMDGGDWKAVDAIKHRLLYCHSVAFDDPMPGVASLAIAQLRIPQPIHNGLLNYVNLLLHFGDLIRKHVVCPVSHESYLRGHGRPDYVALGDEIQASVDKSNLPDIDELLEAAPEDIKVIWRADLKHESGGSLVKSASLVKASERISQALSSLKNAPGRLSLYFPFRYDVRLLERWRGPESLREFRDRDIRALNGLVDLEMPNLESLGPSEILAVRSGDEFEQWRRSLKAALADAGQLPADLLNRAQEVRNVVDEQLIDGKARLEGAISKSQLLSGARKGAVTLLAGTASGIVVSYLTNNNFLATMAGVSTSAAINTAAEAISTPKTTEAQRAVLAHYVALLR